MSDFAGLDGTAQAELVRSGSVSALELVDAAIDRIEEINPTVNAVISTDFDRARDAARTMQTDTGPFPGVPFLLKDLGANQAGLPYWVGNRAMKEAGHRSTADDPLGARFRTAGFVTLGKTNVPEAGSAPSTQPISCGPTRNPWDLERSPAGSSGGSGAAVAAGMVPVAHANDGGGSTRLPAAWCGLVGLKPSRGRIPSPTVISRLVSELVVSHTVRDTAAVLDAVHGADDTDLYSIGGPVRPYVDELTAEPRELTVGVIANGGYDVDPECVAGVEETAKTLEALGHHVVPVESADPLFIGGEMNRLIFPFNTARHFSTIAAALGRPLTEDDLEPNNWAAAGRAAKITGPELFEALEQQQVWAARAIDWCRQFDVVLTPTAGCPPMTTAELDPPADRPGTIGATYGMIVQFTFPFNVTGQPAISLPLHWTPEGLPVGIQLVGGMGREDLLIRIAAQLESARPWAHRTPTLT